MALLRTEGDRVDMTVGRHWRLAILAAGHSGTMRLVGVGSLRTGIVAAWIVVFGNGTLFFLARRVLDLPGTWEGPVLRPAIVLSVGLAAGMVVLDGQRTSGARLRPVPVVPFSAAVGLGVWAAVTTWWSLEPEVTLWRGVGYAFLPLVAWVIADLPATQFRRALGAGAGLDLADSRGRTGLMEASEGGHLGVVEMLVSRGAGLELEDREGPKDPRLRSPSSKKR